MLVSRLIYITIVDPDLIIFDNLNTEEQPSMTCTDRNCNTCKHHACFQIIYKEN